QSERYGRSNRHVRAGCDLQSRWSDATDRFDRTSQSSPDREREMRQARGYGGDHERDQRVPQEGSSPGASEWDLRTGALGPVMLEPELPYPPSLNHSWRHVGPRTLISRQGRVFRVKVCSLLAARGIRPLSGSLAVRIRVHPPDERRRDIDNLPKSLLD